MVLISRIYAVFFKKIFDIYNALVTTYLHEPEF